MTPETNSPLTLLNKTNHHCYKPSNPELGFKESSSSTLYISKQLPLYSTTVNKEGEKQKSQLKEVIYKQNDQSRKKVYALDLLSYINSCMRKVFDLSLPPKIK